MQPALLIDEILQQIFQFSSEDGPRTLSILARSCRTWREPALDHLWMRLSSIIPLLQLIPGIELVDGQYVLQKNHAPRNMARFYLYAQRVKHITHCRSVRVHPDIQLLLVAGDGAFLPPVAEVLPSLRTARVSSPCDAFQLSLSLSNKLRQLDIDLGFKIRGQQVSNDGACHLLEEVAHIAPELEKLSIRGSACSSINSLVSSMQHLHSLSLRVGTSLTPEALSAASHFPLLSELEIHASHFEADSLAKYLCDNGASTFPSLKKLHIRAHAAVIELVLALLPIDTLQTLRVEAEDPADSPISWSPIFKLICSLATNSLQNFTLEHHIELDDSDMDDNTSGDANLIADDNTTIDDKSDTQISFAILKDLDGLNGLRRFILNTTLPPHICDQDFKTLAGWWPELEHLDLGSAATTSCGGGSAECSMTLQSLIVCAEKLPNLASLILPADANVARVEASTLWANSPGQTKLTRITLGHFSTPDPVQLARYLYRLFPSLIEIDGLSEHEEQWNRTRAALQDQRLDGSS